MSVDQTGEHEIVYERPNLITRRETVIFAVIALVIAFIITFGVVGAPGYTDVYYHFNAAKRLATGLGLSDTYLWTYIGAPDRLPAPSHLYWMPLTSILAAISMAITGSATYAAAQIPLAILFAGTAMLAFRIGWRIMHHRRGAWLSGLITLFSGFFTRYWGAVDTFAPYAFIGALCLYAFGSALMTRQARSVWMIAGGLAALAHLTRADGLLLIGVGVLLSVWRMIERRRALHRRIVYMILMVLTYLMVMSPWFLRNQFEIGTPLPIGGTQAIWFSQYDDLFNFPPDANPSDLGINGFIESRREALVNNIGTFVAVEGMIAMTPFMLIGLWRRRRDPFLRPFWVYALLLHIAMTFVFPYPGYRGGLLHSAAALIPFWAVLGVAGIDDSVKWIAARRRRWQPETAKRVFSFGLLGLAILLSVQIGLAGRVAPRESIPTPYLELSQYIPAGSRVMINDPAALYYFTGIGGVVIPNEDPTTLLEVANQYQVSYLVLEVGGIPAGIALVLESPPNFLIPIPLDIPNVRLYAITITP